jgi:thiol-disulfide isomerase/thioredoxin
MVDNYNKYLKYKEKYLRLKTRCDSRKVKMPNILMGGGSTKEKEVLFFSMDGCPHCENFKPEWDKLKQKYKNKYDLREINANDKENESWKINSFPTIIVKKGNEAMEHMGKNDFITVSKFIELI